MKKILSKMFITSLLGLSSLTSLAQAEKNEKPWRLGLRFDQFEQTRQALSLSHRILGSDTYAGILVGSQGFREVNESGIARIRAATDAAAILHNETLIHPNFMLATGLALGQRRVPKRDGVKTDNHAYLALEESVGLKQGSVFLFLGVGYRTNFTEAKDPPYLGSAEVPMSMVYPRIGFDIAL